MRFQVLGDLAVWDERGERLAITGPSRRALLALLLLNANQVLSRERLIDELWGARAPATAAKSLQVHVWRLRKTLGANGTGPLRTEPGGYVLEVGPGELDLMEFDRLLSQGRSALAAGRAEAASRALADALALWRGIPLEEFCDEPFAIQSRPRLEELRMEALEARVEADLQLGLHRALVAELERLTATDPLRERLRAQLMVALYRCGRQADALAVYRNTRRLLHDELGLEPGPELRGLEQAILTQDPQLDPPPAQARAAEDAASGPARHGSRPPTGRWLLAVGVVAAVAAALLITDVGVSGRAPRAAANSVVVISPRGDRVVGQIAVGTQPSQLSQGSGSVWVANLGDGTVSQVDPRSRQVVRTLAVGQSAANSVAGVAAGHGVFWTLDDTGTVRRVDLLSDSVQQTRVGVPFGAPLSGLWTLGPDTVLIGKDAAWVIGIGQSTVDRLSLRTGRLLDHIDVGTNPASLALGYGSVWVTDSADDTVSRIDQASLAVTQTIPVGHNPSGVAAGDGAVWVADTADNSVVRIDPDTGAVTDTIPVASGPRGVAVGAGAVWVADSRAGAVSRIDPVRRRVVATIPVGQSPEDVAVVGASVLVSVQRGSASYVSGGGTGLRLRVVAQTDPEPSTDPALVADNPPDFQFGYLTCATLLGYPDRSGPAGARLVPEVAQTMPTVSDRGRTYRFRLRGDYRFSPPSGAVVNAQAFARAIERELNPHMSTYNGTLIQDIVGAKAYAAGRVSSVRGVSAHGDQLTIHLTRADPQFVFNISTLGFCAVPPGTPINPNGVPDVPSAGPYYVARHVPDHILVLARNPYYHGPRPRRVSQITVYVGSSAQSGVREVLSGHADYVAGVPPQMARGLATRYGQGSRAGRAGDQQYFESPSLAVWYLALNTTRPLFSSARARQAVNFAINRRDLAAVSEANNPVVGAVPDAQYLPPGLPGYSPEAIYPLGAPEVNIARRLLRGHAGTGLIYTYSAPPGPQLAEIVRDDLAAVGIQLQIRTFGKPEMYQRIATPGEPWDLALTGWAADYPDPSNFLNFLFDSRDISPSATATGNYNNWARFSSPHFDQQLRSASLLMGASRDRTYGRLAVRLARDAAPLAAWGSATTRDLFAARIGCRTYQPVYGFDLATLCLRTRNPS
jgi:YVTN family beta-propeller protein